MREFENLKIISFVGLSGSGKTAASTYVASKDYPRVHFGSVILNALRDAGLEPTLENEKMMRDKLRQENGDDVVVQRVVQQIRDLAGAGQRRIITDGMGSWLAYRAMKREFPASMMTIAITTPRIIRHRRMTQRSERPLTEREVDLRDYDEIETLDKGGVIAIADYFIDNSGDIDKLHEQVDKLLEEIKF